MSNNYEEIEKKVKKKVNEYMEQIEVPKNLGGIIMEDFEKVKKQEAEMKNESDKSNNKKKIKNKKALKISAIAVSAVVVIGIGVFIGNGLLGNNAIFTKNIENSNIVANNKAFDKKVTIKENQIENFEKLNQFLRNTYTKEAEEDEIEIETFLEPESERAAVNKDASKLSVKYDGTKYNVKYDIAEGTKYAKQTIEGEFSDILIRKTTSQNSEYVEIELSFYRTNGNKLEVLPVFFFKLSELGTQELNNDYTTYKKMNDEISDEIYNGLYNIEKDLKDKFGESVYKEKMKQLGITDESAVVNLINKKEENTSKDLVTDALTYTGKIEENITISYKVPKININSEDVAKINSEIESKVTTKAKKAINDINTSDYTALFKVYYNYYTNNNILSILIGVVYDEELKDYITYNIDIKTGKQLSNEDILKVKNMTKKDFEEKLINACKNIFLSKYGTVEKWISTQSNKDKKFYQENFDKIISSSNCNADNQNIYLDKNKNINVAAKIYSLAGPESNIELINIESYKESKQSLTSAEQTKLTNFLNQTENNPFILFNYDGPDDLFKHANSNINKPENVLRYAIVKSSYSSIATNEQNKVIWKELGGEAQIDTYVIKEDDLINFLKDKLDYTYSKEEIKKEFSNDYKKDIDLYAFMVSDSSFTKAIIKDGYKISNEYGTDYYLTLNHGQEIILHEEKENSKIFFQTCTGFDGTIGE